MREVTIHQSPIPVYGLTHIVIWALALLRAKPRPPHFPCHWQSKQLQVQRMETTPGTPDPEQVPCSVRSTYKHTKPPQAGAVANIFGSPPPEIPTEQHPNIVELRRDDLPEDARKTLYKHLTKKLNLQQYIQFYHLINPEQRTLDQQVDQLMEWYNNAPDGLQAILNTQNSYLDRAFRTMVPAGMKQATKEYPFPSTIVKYYLTIQLGINPHSTSGGATSTSSHPGDQHIPTTGDL